MEDIFAERVAGLDVSKRDVKACVRVCHADGRVRQQTKTFTSTTIGLLLLQDWLAQQHITLVGMESTGVYWKPVFYMLEDQFTCWLINPVQVKKVPGRKTDVTDAQWIARLLQAGLLRASFVPPPPIRALRDLTRYRFNVVRDRVRAVQRLEDLLEDAGLKLSSVISDITGVSGKAMLQRLIQDPTATPGQVADLAKARMRNKMGELIEALTGHFNDHHARLAATMLRQISDLEEIITDLNTQIEAELAPFAAAAARLTTIPGIGERGAAIIIAEIGVDMTRFPTPADLSSWAGLCPGNNESAGRHLSSRTRKGNPHLRALLFEAACAASRTRHTYLAAKYHDLAARRGRTRALVALSRIIAETCWRMLSTNTDYHDLGPDHINRHRHTEQHRAAHLTHQLQQLGYTVTKTPAA